jgi:hypothetical protein
MGLLLQLKLFDHHQHNYVLQDKLRGYMFRHIWHLQAIEIHKFNITIATLYL